MKNYEIEINQIKDLYVKIESLNNAELLETLNAICGITLIGIQKTEFVIHGIVSHFNENILKRHKQFEKLSPRIFLDNDEFSKKRRKQTLGLIIKILLENNSFFDTNELNDYVEKRNIFIHLLWRDFLSGNKAENREEILKCIEFVLEFCMDNIKWDSHFKGFFYMIGIQVAEKENRDADVFKKYEKNYEDLVKYILEQKLFKNK